MNLDNFLIAKVVIFCCLIFWIAINLGALDVKASLFLADVGIGTVDLSSEGIDNRVAPGEFLSVSVKLINFGSQKRVDVTVAYQILDSSGEEVYSEAETVAVETTASFIKRVQLPYAIAGGSYLFIATLNYPYQEYPAVSKFVFSVEKKIFGIFKSDLILYSIVFVLLIAVAIGISYFFAKWNKGYSILAHDYSDKPKDQMIYYEILDDVISQMRLRLGDDALEIARGIPDLEINTKNGLIINIKKNPAKIIALLISRFEKASGRRVSFGIRRK